MSHLGSVAFYISYTNVNKKKVGNTNFTMPLPLVIAILYAHPGLFVQDSSLYLFKADTRSDDIA